MQGKYVTVSDRQLTRRVSAELVVPNLLKEELLPLKPLLNVRTDIVALDIGANKGFWAKALLRMCGDKVQHIFLVEPSPENCAELTRRDDSLVFDKADFDQLSVYQFAMGSKEGHATLYTNEDGSPLASLYPHTMNGYAPSHLSDIHLSEAIDVSVTTVDALLENIGNPHIDIMKIDVEGHEFEVLRGAHGALSRFAIDVIGLEFGIHQVESRHFFKDFYTLFRDYGFTVYFARGGDLHKVTRYEYQYEVFTSNFQLIAAQERIAERLNTHGSWHDAALQQYQSSLQAKEAEIADLKMALSRMQTVYERSTSWRLTAPMRKVITAIRR